MAWNALPDEAPRPVAQCRQFQEGAKYASVSECTWTLSTLEALRNALYKFKTYFYLLTGTKYNDWLLFLARPVNCDDCIATAIKLVRIEINVTVSSFVTSLLAIYVCILQITMIINLLLFSLSTSTFG